MSSETPSQTPNQTQDVSLENINIETVKQFEKKYNVQIEKDKVATVIYRPKWNLKQLVEEAKEYAATMNRVVRILGVFSLGFGKSISITITPSGYIRFSIMIGFRIGLNRPNAIDVGFEDITTLKILVEQLQKIAEQIQG